MKFKKSLILLLTVGLVAGMLVGCGGKSKTNGKNDLPVIKIATQTPLSGGSATIGEVIKLGAQLALDDQKEKFKEMGLNYSLSHTMIKRIPKKEWPMLN